MKSQALIKLVLPILIQLSILPIKSQSNLDHWARTSKGGVSAAGCETIAIDKAGNVFVCGCFGDTFILNDKKIINPNYDPIGFLNSAIFIAKYDPYGKIMWAKSIYGNSPYPTGINIDIDGNVLLTGDFQDDSLVIDNIKIKTYNSRYDGFIVKYDTNGNALWAKSIGGELDDATYYRGVITDSIGNIYVSGSIQSKIIDLGNLILKNNSASPAGGIFLIKMDSNGNALWAKSTGGNGSGVVNDLTMDFKNNVIISGVFSSTYIAFDSIRLDNLSSNWDIFTTKYDSNGNALWAFSAGGNYIDIARSVGTDLEGNIYTSGSSRSDTLKFDNLNLIKLGTKYYNDLFVVKHSKDGQLLWAKLIDNGHVGHHDYAQISVLKNGDFYLFGTFDSLAFNKGQIVLPFFGGYMDIFIIKYDKEGNSIFGKSIGGSAIDWIMNSKIDDQENIYLIGEYSGKKMSIGMDTLCNFYGGDFSFTRRDTFEIFVTKMGKLTTSTIDRIELQEIMIFPNPTYDFLYLSSAENVSQVRIINPYSGNYITQKFNDRIDLSNYSPGFYFVDFLNVKGHSINRKKIFRM